MSEGEIESGPYWARWVRDGAAGDWEIVMVEEGGHVWDFLNIEWPHQESDYQFGPRLLPPTKEGTT